MGMKYIENYDALGFFVNVYSESNYYYIYFDNS